MLVKIPNIWDRYHNNATCIMAFSICIVYGLILNPIRAFLYSVAIIIAVRWCIIFLVLLSMIFKRILKTLRVVALMGKILRVFEVRVFVGNLSMH